MESVEKIPFIKKLLGKVSDLLEKTVEEQFLNYFKYGLEVEKLKKSVENLQRRRDMKKHLVVDEYRNGKDTAPDVLKWLDDVDDIITKIEEFWQDKRLPYTVCSKGYLPKPGMRYRLAKKTYRLAKDVDDLLKTSFSDGLSSGVRPMSIDFLLAVVNFESFNSRKQLTEDITKALKDATTKMVGVYGTGGVGKTTLVKEVAGEALRDKLFDAVLFVTVTRNPDIKQIQGQLADQLGSRLDEETEIGRASRLRDIFKNEKKNTLVTLDDLWDELDLNKLGIPVDDANHSSGNATGESKMLKILLTSRSKEVVCDKMHVKENSAFPVKVLEDQEAEALFKKMVEMDDKPLDEFGPLATKISKHCGGLPIVIVTIGKTLRTKSYSQWEETLGQLERKEFTEVAECVDFSTRVSFKYLENEELKSIFLLCAQLGYHPLIMDLVKHCIGVGIFEGFLTIKETREKVLRLIKKLKGSSMLLDSYSNDRFNMHDMIRETALSIASKERRVFTMENGELKEWPHENEFKKYNGISIRNCQISDELSDSVSCPRLKSFHVDSLNPSFNIPKGFFNRARQLRVLKLTSLDVSNFCASIGCLTNLRMLCLEKCKLLCGISFIKDLEKLRILSLVGSIIQNLPTELGQLHKLQLLDISNCSELGKVPPKSFSNLSSLEELYMRNSVKLDSEEILAELRHLHRLKNLDMSFPSVAFLPRNLFLNKLDSYKIFIGDIKRIPGEDFKMPGKDEAARVLALQIEEPDVVIHHQEGVKILLRGVEKMLLGQLNGVENIFCELNLEGFPCLKELVIVCNSDIKCIIDPKEFLNHNDVFPILESLCLYRVFSMKKIISHSTNLSGTSFSRLKVVKIQFCNKLEYVFSFSMVKLLINLETIDISLCTSMKTIVPKEEPAENIKFAKLRSLVFNCLSNFTGVYSNDPGPNGDDIILFNEQVEIPNLEILHLSSLHMKEISNQSLPLQNLTSNQSLPLRNLTSNQSLPLQNLTSNQSLPLQNLTKLNVQSCTGIQHLFSFSMAKSMKKLKVLSVSGCEEMVEIFKYESEDIQEARKVCVLPKLEEINLNFLDRLTTIWPTESSPESFTNLKSMFIAQCDQLVTVLPSHIVGRFGRLESLRVASCDLVEQIFDLHGAKKPSVGDKTHLQILQIYYLKKLKHIWNRDPEGIINFERLHSIDVASCYELEYLFPASTAKGVQELDSLSVSNCPQMVEIARSGDHEGLNMENIEFPQVSVVKMKNLPKLKRFFKGPTLKKLSVFHCVQLLETFKTGTQNSEEGSVFLSKEVIPNLETLEMNLEEVEKQKTCIKNYRFNHLKNFMVVSCHSIEILNQFLYRMPYLERLTLIDCDLRELIPTLENNGNRNSETKENIGNYPQLKYLKIENLNALVNIGFERGPILQYFLEHLYIRGCEELINLGPFSVTLTHLTTLEVHDCERMTNLMGFSTAKSLVQLVTLKVIGCKGLEQIVARQNNDEIEITSRHEIVFSKLMTLELGNLHNLLCFCSFEIHEFPSLEKLTLKDCPSMTKFCDKICTAPNLPVIDINGEEKKWSWEGDMNDIILKMNGGLCPKRLSLSENAELADIWKRDDIDPFLKSIFLHLRVLVVENCKFLPTVIPSHMLRHLQFLYKLEVRRCSSVEDNVNGKFFMTTLILDNLPNMKNVWSKNPEGILSFQLLEQVEVTDCDCVETLFPTASITKGLERLTIRNCGSLEHIVGKVEAYEEGAIVEELKLPYLKSLIIRNSPKLKSGNIKLRCPSLKFQDLYDCGEFTKLQILASESFQPENAEDRICSSSSVLEITDHDPSCRPGKEPMIPDDDIP